MVFVRIALLLIVVACAAGCPSHTHPSGESPSGASALPIELDASGDFHHSGSGYGMPHQLDNLTLKQILRHDDDGQHLSAAYVSSPPMSAIIVHIYPGVNPPSTHSESDRPSEPDFAALASAMNVASQEIQAEHPGAKLKREGKLSTGFGVGVARCWTYKEQSTTDMLTCIRIIRVDRNWWVKVVSSSPQLGQKETETHVTSLLSVLATQKRERQ